MAPTIIRLDDNSAVLVARNIDNDKAVSICAYDEEGKEVRIVLYPHHISNIRDDFDFLTRKYPDLEWEE